MLRYTISRTLMMIPTLIGAVFAFNLFGDALRDYFDPRFKT